MSQYRRDVQLETFWGNIFSCDSPWWRLVMMISLYSYHGRKAFQNKCKNFLPREKQPALSFNSILSQCLEFQEKGEKKKISMEFSKLVLKFACWGQRTCSPEGIYRLPFLPRDLAMFVTAEHGTWRSEMVSRVFWQLRCQTAYF